MIDAFAMRMLGGCVAKSVASCEMRFSTYGRREAGCCARSTAGEAAGRYASSGFSVIVIVLLAAIIGCGPPYPYTPYPPRAYPALGDLRSADGSSSKSDTFASIRVFYATDRRVTGSPVPALFYGIERQSPHYGVARVSIPAGHGRGREEEPLPPFPQRAERHVSMMSVEPVPSADSYLEVLRHYVGQSSRKQVLVFVHGYAVTHEAAVRRTAQLAHDADFDGVPLAYSWPTQGSLLSYLADVNNAEWTEPHLVDLLDKLVEQAGAERIHLVAHSMGARVLTHALREFVRKRQIASTTTTSTASSGSPYFDKIVLAAADMDAEVFIRDYLPDVAVSARRVTIYVSAGDWALAGSRRMHKYTRLGEPDGPALTQLPPNVDVVDATAVDRGIVGHLYYGDSPAILEDLRQLLLGVPAEERGLVRRGRGYAVEPG